MKINSKNAISYFFPNPSFKQVYFEAVANAIDAGATEISINIEIAGFEQAGSLVVSISDNGKGFVDENFRKFSSLLEANCPEHKGLGRLVFLEYFDEIEIESSFEGTKQRAFRFDQVFDGESTVTEIPRERSGTKLTFKRFSGERIKTYSYLRPADIKEALISHFFPRFFSLKENGGSLNIEIKLVTETPNQDRGFVSESLRFSLADLPLLTQVSVSDGELDLFQDINIHYSIVNDNTRPKSLVTAICVDGRTVPYDLVSQDCIPGGHQVLFLFASDFFRGKTDSSRQRLDLPNNVSERTLKFLLRNEMNRIISVEIPRVQQENQRLERELDDVYPHLSGYFPEDTVGLIVKDDVIKSAREHFFADQKAVLECEDLDDATYEKALDVSARVLTEYILYRTRIIAKLKSMDVQNHEGDIHDIIVPRRTTHHGQELSSDIFNCNVWLLDDKYMSYTTVLSDQTMKDVIREISIDGEGDQGRPDITIVFSGDPQEDAPVDLVIVELKKHGARLAEKEEAVSQLRQRARRLLEFYPNKINRIWFYAVTDIDSEFKRSLKEDDFVELFSQDAMFYKPQPVILENEERFLVDLYVLTYESLIGDAESRNSTFLKVLKDSIRHESRRGESELVPIVDGNIQDVADPDAN